MPSCKWPLQASRGLIIRCVFCLQVDGHITGGRLSSGGGGGYKRLFSFMVFFSVLQNLTKLLKKAFEFY